MNVRGVKYCGEKQIAQKGMYVLLLEVKRASFSTVSGTVMLMKGISVALNAWTNANATATDAVSAAAAADDVTASAATWTAVIAVEEMSMEASDAALAERLRQLKLSAYGSFTVGSGGGGAWGWGGGGDGTGVDGR